MIININKTISYFLFNYIIIFKYKYFKQVMIKY